MSVLAMMKVKGDTARFRRVLETETERLQGLAAQARAAGAVHHRFGVGDGYVLIVDEWETAEDFQGLMANPETGEVMGDMGR